MSYIVHGGPLFWGPIAAAVVAVLAWRWLTHRHFHLGPLPRERYVPAHAPGGGVSPRAAAGPAPGGEDGLYERAGVLPAGRDEQAADDEWADTLHYWADEERGRSGMPLAAPPWTAAPEPVVVEPAMLPLPEDERPAWEGLYRDERPPQPKAEDWTGSDQALCLCPLGPDVPGEPITSEADCPAHGDPDAWLDAKREGRALHGLNHAHMTEATVTDMRAVPAAVAAREHAISRIRLKAHVSVTLARKPPLRQYVEDVIGISPAEDWEQLLVKARAGGSDE